MRKFIALLFLGLMAIKLTAMETETYYMIWQMCETESQQLAASDLVKCAATPLSIEEFRFMAQVVEAESDRSSSREGKRLIACVIINRAYQENGWPNSVTEVLTQSGQFAVVSCGRCSVTATDSSELAIVEAFDMVASGEVPENLLFLTLLAITERLTVTQMAIISH